MLKWISSFPGNPSGHGLPTVMGVVCLSDAATSAPLLLLDARAVTALRTGAVAAVAAQALAGPRALDRRDRRLRPARGVGGALPGRRGRARGDLRGPAAGGGRRAGRPSSAGRPGTREAALAADVVCCVTPGHEPVVGVEDLRPGLHLNMLGADGPGKAEATVEAVAACSLFCDEWEQASHGGELTRAVEAGVVGRERVTGLGAVLAGAAPGPHRPGRRVTLFDSTGLAIQDLAIAVACHAALERGAAEAQIVRL